ncbi:PucR family transcriptional regulator [Streptomyces monticola]|uniref:PucR family transcriptional regulator n=2 Tax=Streptomyces monticola TaxID=2666263 RepID=A0ABW2JTN2_9ACTN
MRPELPSLIEESIAEVRRAIPGFSVGPNARALRQCAETALTAFVAKVESPDADTAQRDEVLRGIGRSEAYAGHSMEDMRAAFRLGARIGLRRAKQVGRRYGLSPALLLAVADAIFAYVEELIAVSSEGYEEATAELSGGREAQRAKLLRELLTGAADRHDLPHRLGSLARLAAWPLPDEVTLVALSSRTPREAWPADVLLDPDDPQPYALVPGPFDAVHRAALAAGPKSARAAVGPTVRTGQAADSLRWARQILALTESGGLPDKPVTYCEDHLTTLWLLRDPALLAHIAARQLAPLTGLTATQRARLLETLDAWLATRGNAVQMAESLHLHPQTVRYRLRLLDAAFGGQLTDPDGRFSTELAVRGLALPPPEG